VCYFLVVASPLTLSEIRSMLPDGLAAHPLGTRQAAGYRLLLPPAQTVASLVVGSCSCDLVRPRQPDQREDERHLRDRYARLGLGRDRIIRELERHRRGAGGPAPRNGWARELAAFAAEHARNAGPTLYHLKFEPAGDDPAPLGGGVVTRSLLEVQARPAALLQEGPPILLVR
jgi:hypothetical protein